jgi:hypothetical protein
MSGSTPHPSFQGRAAALRSVLFASLGRQVFAVVDADLCPQLLPMIERHQVPHACLLGPYHSPAESRRAPHLVQLDVASPFTDWLLSGWGRCWGIYAVSRSPLPAMRDHFRSFLVVADPQGNPLFFRYYDPRVLGVYLPTVNEPEAGIVFGPVEAYFFEQEDTAAILRCSRLGQSVKMETLGQP